MSLMKLNTLLDRVTDFEPEYDGGMSSHLPMALVALQRLGASEARLDDYYASYVPRLGIADAMDGEIPPDFQWTDALGRLDKFRLARRYFQQRLGKEKKDKVLRKVLPVLFKGVGAAAFHGLIRTAYALEAQRDNELAVALSYWTCRFLPLAENEPTSGGARCDEWLKSFISLSPPDGKFGLIFEKMHAVARSKDFSRLLNGLAVDGNTLASLSQYACGLYLRQKDFTVLHLITGTHAARLLMPWISDQEEAIRNFAIAYAAGLVAADTSSDVASRAPTDKVSWNEIISCAVSNQDDHVIKLVYSCMQEGRHYGSTFYKTVASSVVNVENLA